MVICAEVPFYMTQENGANQIKIYHKGCGTMGVPVFASENIELTFAFNFKKNTSGKIS